VGHVALTREIRNVHRILVRKPEGNRLLGRLRQRWNDNIKTNMKEIVYEDCGLDSSGSEYILVVVCCEHGNDPLVSIKGVEFFNQLSDH